MADENQPIDFYLISDLETLRVFADPLHAQIYDMLTQTPMNVRQIAERLGLSGSRLYYHMNMLEKVGLIRVIETRMVANMIEKVYRAIAYKLDVARDLLDFSQEEHKQAITDVLTTGLDATREEILRSIDARTQNLEQGAEPRQRSMMVSRMAARVPDEYAEDFARRLQALVEEFGDADRPPDESGEAYQNYGLLVAFYPAYYYGETRQTE